MKKILLASLAVVASASMMAQTKLMEFKFDNTTMKDQVSGVEIPLAQGTPEIVAGPVAGSKAMHFDGNTWYNLEDCSKVTGTQLGTKEWTIVTWFKMDGTTAETAKEGAFIEVGNKDKAKFFQCELQGGTPAQNLVFFGRFKSGNPGKTEAVCKVYDDAGKHYAYDGHWHMMVGVKSNAAEGPNWWINVDGVDSDDSDADPYALSAEMKNATWDDALNDFKDVRVPYPSEAAKAKISRADLIDANLNYTGNLSLGHNVKDAGTKQLQGTLYTITLYEGAATLDQIRGWFQEVYPDYYTTGGLQDVTVAPVDENAPMYNLQGVQVDDSYQGIVIKNGKKFINK